LQLHANPPAISLCRTEPEAGSKDVTLSMLDNLGFALVNFAAIFFVVDPFAVIPLFLSITAGDDEQKKSRTALKAAIVTTVTLLAFALTGSLIFRLFGITLGAFRIAGGILLFLLALDMVRAQHSRVRVSPEEQTEGVEKEDVAIIPLGIPMLAGPGSIAIVMVLMAHARSSPSAMGIVLGCILLTGVLIFLILRASVLLERTLHQTGLNILNRVMGLLLAAVAVQFVVNGVAEVLPQILKPGG
jgi:multiple antibiotic resistance protein